MDASVSLVQGPSRAVELALGPIKVFDYLPPQKSFTLRTSDDARAYIL
jgi:hypothetical protein